MALLELVPHLLRRALKVADERLLGILKHEVDLASCAVLGNVVLIQAVLLRDDEGLVLVRDRRDDGRLDQACDVTHQALGAQVSAHVGLPCRPVAQLELGEARSGGGSGGQSEGAKEERG